MNRAQEILEYMNYVRGEKVLAHVGGPSGAGKTELVIALTPKVKNIELRDLDEFDDYAVDAMGLNGVSKNDYTNQMLLQHHRKKQHIIDNFIQKSSKPIIFFGHTEEAGNEIQLPTSVRILLSTNPRTASIRRAKNRELSPQELRDLIRTGREDIKYLRGKGYIPMTARQIYNMILFWSRDGF